MSGSPSRSALLACLLFIALSLAVAVRAEPLALRQVALQDQRARPVTAASLEGRVLLLHFVYTGCSATCPTQVRELVEVYQALPPQARAATRWLSVSVDPANDTPATLAAFAQRLGAEQPGWRFATGAPAQVELLLERMRVMDPTRRPARPEDHRTSLFLFDARGELVQRFAGVPVDRARLVREIAQLATLASAPPKTSLAKARP